MTGAPPTADRDRAVALIVAALGLLAIGHAVIFIRWAGDASALLLAAGRVAIATAVFAPFAVPAFLDRARRPSARAVGISLAAGLCLALHFGAWIESVQRLTIAESALLVSLAPLWLALWGALAHRRMPAKDLLIGLGLCLSGLAVVGWNGLAAATADPLGLALALVGGIAMAAYLACGKRVRGEVPTHVYVALCYGGASVALALSAVVGGVSVSGLSAGVWTAILGLGLVSQTLGHTAYNFALGRLSPVFVGICLLGEPVAGSLLGLLYLGEAIPPLTLLGGVPILLGLWLALRAELRN
jgi:drug/metabolite transporter (DMT)-like permease